jgi:hypothetical protein
MKIVTNSKNINSLKLLVSSNLAKQQVELECLPCQVEKDILPFLEVDGGKLFMPGLAAIFHLQEGGVLLDEEVHKLESLLEWESNSLYPMMVSLLQHK